MAAGGYEVVDPMREFDDIFFMREVNEGLAARLAAQRGTEAEVAEIVRLGERSAALELDDVESRATINTAFHTAIARASHAPRLMRQSSKPRHRTANQKPCKPAFFLA